MGLWKMLGEGGDKCVGSVVQGNETDPLFYCPCQDPAELAGGGGLPDEEFFVVFGIFHEFTWAEGMLPGMHMERVWFVEGVKQERGIATVFPYSDDTIGLFCCGSILLLILYGKNGEHGKKNW